MSSHHNLSQSELILEPQIKSVFEYSFNLANGDKYCRRCQKKFTNSDFISHQKNCLRNSTKKQTKSLTFSSSDGERLSLFSSSIQPSVDRNNQYAKNIVDTITQAMVGVLRASVVLFVDKNRHLSNDALLHVIMSKSMQFNRTLGNIFKQDELKVIQQNKYLAPIITQISDIFDRSLIERKISTFSKNKQQKIRNMLNKLMKEKGLPQIYEKNPLQYETEQAKLPLMFSQFRSFVLSLLKTRKKNYVHLALDLLIIFHSQQRMPSSTTIVKEAILEILNSNQTYSKIKCAMKQKNKQLLVINKQLKAWLKEFNWTDFSLSERALGRVSQFLNFSLISLRKGLYCQIYIHVFHTSIKHLTFHKVETSVDHYLTQLKRALLQQFHEKLDIFDDKYAAVDMDKIMPKVIYQIPGQTVPYHLSQFNQVIQEDLIIETKPREDKQINEVEENQIDQEQQQSEISEEESKKIKILEMEYEISKGKFKSSIFEDFKSNELCKVCTNSKCQKICLYCCSNYHTECLPQFCGCMKFISPQTYIRVQESSKKINHQINLPEHYFTKNSHYLDELRKLIHLRGFYFCTAAISRFTNDQICTIPNIQQITIAGYELYENGLYCPPIIFAPSGDDNMYGTGVGVFASETISKGVFIGEYGGTIVEEDELILLKRKDMSMKLCVLNNKAIYIGADHHCSYVQLINGCNTGKANCQMKTLVVNGKLKLILYTLKQIAVGEELIYDYGKGFNVKYQTKLSQKLILPTIMAEKQDSIQLENFLINLNPSVEQNLKLTQNNSMIQEANKMQAEKNEQNSILPMQGVSLGVKQNFKQPPKKIKIEKCLNSCYAYTSIVIFKLLSKYLPNYSTRTLTRELLSSKEFKVSKYIKKFEKERKNQTKNRQEDFDEFFLFIKKMLEIDCPFDQLVVQSAFFCEQCQKETKKIAYEDQFRTHQLKVSFEEDYIVQKKCEHCSINKNQAAKRTILSSPPLIVLNFPSTYHNGTKRSNIFQVRKIKHNEFLYIPKIVAIHHGHQTESGHFVTLDAETNMVYDAGQLRNFNQIYDNHICMIVLEKVQPEHIQNPLIDKKLKGCGLYVSVKEKINIVNNLDSYYNIASIVKIITFLTCQKLVSQLGLTLKTTFSAPKCSQLWGTMAGLRQNNSYTLNQLYHYMLIISACDAAFTLSVSFGDLIRDLNRTKDDLPSEQIFINEMAKFCFELKMYNTVIQDACGLKRNVSCVQDLLILINEAMKNNIFIQICRQSSYDGYDNSNIFCDIMPGKTGTHRGGVCFLGKNEESTIAMLNVQDHKIRQQFMGNWLNQKKKK